LEKKELLYEGKAKRVYATENAEIVIQEFKDDATAFNGEKKGTIVGKGVINNKISCKLFKMLEKEGVPTHLLDEIDERNMLIKKVDIVKLEVIVRNIAAGSFSKRFGVEEGRVFTAPTLEFSYKDDSLGDPLMNDYHAIAIGIATRAEIDTISKYALKINEVLKSYFDARNIILVDFKLEFGRLADGTIVLADEISPDTCRFWDKDTKEKLDKDRFRRNLGNVEEAYQEMLKRLS
jgi:phosphoribosylaminoimidazole-succinocarboxamide synthase